MCIYVSMTQVTGFRAVFKTAVRRRSSSSYIGYVRASEENLDSPKSFTTVADVTAQCEFKS